jgi:excisionase family DNA binding protein
MDNASLSVGRVSNLLDIKEISELLKVPKQTIYYWVSRNEVPYLKIGRHLRFFAEEVIAHFRDKNHRREDRSCISVASPIRSHERSLKIRGVRPASPRKGG